MERQTNNSPNRQPRIDAFNYVLTKETEGYLCSEERAALEKALADVCDYLCLNDKAPEDTMEILDTLFGNHIESKLINGD